MSKDAPSIEEAERESKKVAEGIRIAALTRRLAGNVPGVTDATASHPDEYQWRPDEEIELWEGRPVSNVRDADGTPRDPRHPERYDHRRALREQGYWDETDAERRRAFSFDGEHATQIRNRRAAEQFEKDLAASEARRAKEDADRVAADDARQMAAEREVTNTIRRVNGRSPVED